jgi:hypothetical protein
LCCLTRNVPDSNRLIERGRNDEVLGRVELGAHDVVVVAGDHGHAVAGLPVPDANSLKKN